MAGKVEEALRAAAKEGTFEKIWSKTKADVKKAATGDNKKDIEKLYKELDGGLTNLIKKFQSATTLEKAKSYAAQATPLIKTYRDKVKAGITNAELKLRLDGTLKALGEYFTSTITRIESLHEDDADDLGASSRLKELAKNGKLHTAWGKIKETSAKAADKDDKKVLDDLYKEFDGNLRKAIQKFEQCGSIDKALPYAQQAIAICDDYKKKVHDSDIGDAALRMTLSGTADLLGQVLREAVAKIDT